MDDEQRQHDAREENETRLASGAAPRGRGAPVNGASLANGVDDGQRSSSHDHVHRGGPCHERRDHQAPADERHGGRAPGGSQSEIDAFAACDRKGDERSPADEGDDHDEGPERRLHERLTACFRQRQRQRAEDGEDDEGSGRRPFQRSEALRHVDTAAHPTDSYHRRMALLNASPPEGARSPMGD